MDYFISCWGSPMISGFKKYLRGDVSALPKEGESFEFEGREVPMRNGILRFSPDISYSTGNFSKLRERHATLQFDSKNGTTDRMDTILKRTNWPPEFFKGKTVLECGCGAGPDTEILLKLGAKVVSADLAGLDIAKENIGNTKDNTFIQADITDLPFKPGSFDIVFCHRVIQHTPDPTKTLNHILQFVKPGGAVFVHSYARNFIQMFRWKYVVHPFTKNVDSEKLYNFIKGYAPFAFKLTNGLRRLPLIGRYMGYPIFVVVPFLNYRHVPKYDAMSDEEMIDYAVHDTFDAMSPAYDKPVAASTFKKYAEKYLEGPFEVDRQMTVTLLRSLPDMEEKAKKKAA